MHVAPLWLGLLPVVCWVLSDIVRIVLSRTEVGGFVYLDDILLVARRQVVRRGEAQVVRKMTKASFLISLKSICEVARSLDFVGKIFDSARGVVSHRNGLLVGILGLWIFAVLQQFSLRHMSRLLGRLEWVLRPKQLGYLR